MMIRRLFCLLPTVFCAIGVALAAPKEAVQKSVDGHVFRPAVVEATPERIRGLKVPEGFEVSVFARDLKEPRMLAVGQNGDVYVTRRAPHNDVLLIKASAPEAKPVSVASLPDVHGIAIKGGQVYLAAVRKLYVADVQPDGTFRKPRVLYDDLPDAGQHPNRTLGFSPKGELFLSVGSTCNEAPEPNPENATLLRVRPDGSGREIYATGLRNTIGFDWDPKTGQLWGLDHGIDWLGDEEQREEFNQLAEGRAYGWPFVYESGKPNLTRDPEPLKGQTWVDYAKACENPILTYDAHSAPMQMQFYRGRQFPEAYRGDAFAALHGSWNREKPSGYKVVRVKFEQGRPVAFDDFLTGFTVEGERAQFGRPCGLATLPDGSLLVSDDQNGLIYRVRYVGKS